MRDLRLLSPEMSSFFIRVSSSINSKGFEISVCNVISTVLGLLALPFAGRLKDALSRASKPADWMERSKDGPSHSAKPAEEKEKSEDDPASENKVLFLSQKVPQVRA